MPPYNKPEFQISAYNSRNCRNIAEITDFFQTLLLIQFLFNHSEMFTGETRHLVSPYNKASISNFCLEFQKLQKFQISLKCYSSFSSYSIILKFFTGETRHIMPPYNKAGISNFFLLRISEISEITDFFKTLLLLQFLFNYSEIFTGETRHIVPPYNKAGISDFCLKFQVF